MSPYNLVIFGAVCIGIGIGYFAGYYADHPTPILGCKELSADAWKIVEQRLAEKARIEAGKPIEKSWFNLPDNRRSLDLAHMRALDCSDVPGQ